jgi:Dyp-type peroxidase family
MALAQRESLTGSTREAEEEVRLRRGVISMPVDLSETRIDHTAEKYQKMLANLQGNILKGHGRDYAVFLCVGFIAERQTVATWMRNFAEVYVTSARQQLEDIEAYRKGKSSGRIFANLFLTAAGYEYLLGLMADDLELRFSGSQGGCVTFWAGMEAASGELSDPDPSGWDVGYRGRQIHAMILLADDDRQHLQAAEVSVLNGLAGIAHLLAEEGGAVLRNNSDKPIEHFGYVDGRSQPLFFKQDLDKEANKAGVTDWEWDPATPLDLVLVPDPNIDEEDCFGSYVVFRKLEQNVKGFRSAERTLALDLPKGDEERAGAMAVGRFKDGTPLTISRKDGMDLGRANNFTYANDMQGLQCPFHAHIRKVNPRGDSARLQKTPAEGERRRHIVRRGLTYGKRRPDLRDAPEYGVGLLFMCFQRDIADQFAFLQKTWASDPCFVKPGTGRDPIIGQGVAPDYDGAQQWPTEWGKPGMMAFDFGGYVTLKGGEFFFAPSIPFLKACRVGSTS